MDDDGDERDDTKRKSRNLSEKKRRDQFNLLVNELSSMVSTNNRKMDKSTVLKSTISLLKNFNDVAVRSRVHEIQEDWKPAFLSNEEFTHLILEALDGFIMVFSSTGRIFYTSESITSLLGYLPSDLLNTSIFDITYDEDRPYLFNVLQSSDEKSDSLKKDSNKDNQVSFSCHLKRCSLDFREEPYFELVQFIGYFRTNLESHDIDHLSPGVPFSLNKIDTRLIFVCTGRLTTPQLIREMPVIDYSNSEFTSRHSLEWKFLFLDHRASPIIGYLPFEVLGTSGYDYYHFDDLESVVSCHEALMQKGEGTSCFYRFLTKGQQWIWLQTRFYITYHQWNSKPEFVVCTHRVVSCTDVIKNVKTDSTSNSNIIIEEYTIPTKQKCEKKETIESPNRSKHNVYGQNESSWTRASSSVSSYSMTPESTSHKRKYPKHSSSMIVSPGPESDMGSISAESIISKQSSNTHHSSQSREMQIRKEIVPVQNLQTSINQQTSLMVHGSVHNSQTISQFIEPSQYVALPVQPVIGFSQLQPLPPPADVGILITPTQAQMQEQLQKKHEELQQMILHQQEELRRVSEQLVMARYGLLPPIINVTMPFNMQGETVLNESHNVFTAGMLPAPPHRSLVIDQNMQQINDPSDFIPMQMSQQQAQLLFSSPNHNQNMDRQISSTNIMLRFSL